MITDAPATACTCPSCSDLTGSGIVVIHYRVAVLRIDDCTALVGALNTVLADEVRALLAPVGKYRAPQEPFRQRWWRCAENAGFRAGAEPGISRRPRRRVLRGGGRPARHSSWYPRSAR